MIQVEIKQLLVHYLELMAVNEVAAILRIGSRSVQLWAKACRLAAMQNGP